jgi:hypothetical protein
MCGRHYRIGDKQAIAEWSYASPQRICLSSVPATTSGPAPQPVIRQGRDTARDLVDRQALGPWSLRIIRPGSREPKLEESSERAPLAPVLNCIDLDAVISYGTRSHQRTRV